MKLCKLKLKNINSFRGEEKLDFEDTPLNDASLVAITGPTGAGKTTLLDAICVALYGKTPRLTGSGTQNPKNLISHGEKECFAEVHFIANNTRYIATWSAKQSGSPNGSLFYADSDELITDRLSSQGKSLGSSEKTISEEITSILGLDFDSFKRSVMLAQGEFAAFLKASRKDRRKILETTAGISIYDDLRQVLIDKVNEVSDNYKQRQTEFDLFADTSPEQLNELNDELNNMKKKAKKLNEKLQQIESDKKQETERKNQYGTLETSKGRFNELKKEQPKIDEYKLELQNAELANQLRAEKQAFDTTQLDRQKSTAALNKAKTELKETENQVKINQSIYDEKKKLYTELSTTHSDKSKIYTQAKSELGKAYDRFEEVNKRKPSLKKLDTDIVELTNGLSEKEQRQKELKNQISEAQTFIEQNPLPSDRDARVVRLTRLQQNINGKQEQLTEKIDEQSEHNLRSDKLSDEVRELSEKRDELRTKHETLIKSCNLAEMKYKKLLKNGTQEDWEKTRETGNKMQLIAQNYEIVSRQLAQETGDLAESRASMISLHKDLEDLEKKLKEQSEICEKADAKVEELETERESTLLANPVNKLRYQLKEGEPCRVCGATHHPYADGVEPESDEQVRSIEEQLGIAEKALENAQRNKRKLEQELVRLQQNKSNTTIKTNESIAEIEKLNSEIETLRGDWQKHYESKKISKQWVRDRIQEAVSALKELSTTNDTYTNENNEVRKVAQKVELSEKDYTHQNNLLKGTEQDLDKVSEEIEDLNADIESLETNFWESIPDVFHTDTTKRALSDFTGIIEKVSTREQRLSTNNSQLNVLNTEIENNRSNLKNLEGQQTKLTTEIEQYQNKGEEFLKVVKEKTGGLKTEDQINDAITKLDIELQAKKDQRDDAHQELLDNQKLSAQKQTAYDICQQQLKENTDKFEDARLTYNEKLEELGFASPNDHSNAFRDAEQMEEFHEKIDAYEDEVQELNDTMIELAKKFEESPFNPDKLQDIISTETDIAEKIQNLQQDIGRKQQIITDLEEKLDKRKILDKELKTAKQEMDRWINLQKIIPQNKLRDFALEIMFQQVSKIANVQLEYLTSERYQLKVEAIGKLSVIDRWNANEERPVETLSGGESFLTSLALALALSELSQGRTQLSSLFLDEGFGTLDAETLDIAIAALEGLRMQGRNIYIISHIQELTRRLPVRINVKKKGDGSSTIDIKG